MGIAVEIRSAVRRYGTCPALSGPSLALEENSLLAVNDGSASNDVAQVMLTVGKRLISHAGLARLTCLLVGFRRAWACATRPLASRGVWRVLITIPSWVTLLIRRVCLKFLIHNAAPLIKAWMAIYLIASPLPLVKANLAVQLWLFSRDMRFMNFFFQPESSNKRSVSTLKNDHWGPEPDLASLSWHKYSGGPAATPPVHHHAHRYLARALARI